MSIAPFETEKYKGDAYRVAEKPGVLGLVINLKPTRKIEECDVDKLVERIKSFGRYEEILNGIGQFIKDIAERVS